MEYTKGERSVSLTRKGHWLVEVGGGLHTPRKTIGYFTKEGDALLDVSAPDLYEALLQAMRTIQARGISENDDRYIMIRKALAKAEGK